CQPPSKDEPFVVQDDRCPLHPLFLAPSLERHLPTPRTKGRNGAVPASRRSRPLTRVPPGHRERKRALNGGLPLRPAGYLSINLPPVPALRQTTYLMDRSGKPITGLHAAVNRTIIPFERMPLRLRQAVVAVEDKRFYSHDGVDPIAIARAAWVDMQDGSFDQGGSTITQQYVKTVFTGSEPTLGRKIREAVMAIKLEHELTKDQILAQYLNTIYYGHGAYGVQAAARTYFGRDAADLTLLQSATLAGAIAGPSRYDPMVHRAAAKVRRNYVLRQMAQVGAIGEARATALSREPVKTVAPQVLRSPAAYFADYTRRFLESRYGSGRVFGGGLRVR